jgi:predicted nucleic acid-binding protein
MIADTNFISDFVREKRPGVTGPARGFLAAHRGELIRTTIISAGEVLPLFRRNFEGWEWLTQWTIYRLHQGIVDAAADVDRELIVAGRRLGENDNWIAGFARYYREPVISRDQDFDRVPELRRIAY